VGGNGGSDTLTGTPTTGDAGASAGGSTSSGNGSMGGAIGTDSSSMGGTSSTGGTGNPSSGGTAGATGTDSGGAGGASGSGAGGSSGGGAGGASSGGTSTTDTGGTSTTDAGGTSTTDTGGTSTTDTGGTSTTDAGGTSTADTGGTSTTDTAAASTTGSVGSTTSAGTGGTGPTPCDGAPCVNGGRCVVVGDDYVCDCLDGYGPPNCSVNIDECADNACENGSTCIDGIADYSCDCADGYEGDLCEDEINECDADPCNNGGSCTDELADFTCSCVDNWGGATCDVKLFEGLGMPATYTASRARAVSDDGATVVGELTGASGTRAFSWSGGTLSVLDSSDHVATANAVSEDGSLVVGSSTDGLKEGAYWLDGDFETIYYTSTSVANTVSGDGWLIAGTCADGFNYACRWTNRLPTAEILSGAYEDSEAWDMSSNGETIVGRAASDPFHAWRWDEDNGWVTLDELPGDDSGFAEVISGDGSVIYGTSTLSGGTDERAVRWVGGATDAESLGFGARVHATNHDGSVIAGHLFRFNSSPFIWDAENGTRELFAALEEAGADMTGWSVEYVEGISADGRTFVGYATHDGVTEAFIARLP